MTLDEQLKLIELSRKDRKNLTRTIIGLHDLVESKTPLVGEWRDFWATNRRQIESFAPESIYEALKAAVERIDFIDPEISSIGIDPSDHVCLLLGAGASVPSPSNIPAVANLLPELWTRARKLGRDDIDRLAKWCEDHQVTNIEDLLTAAYLANFAAKNSNVSGLLNYFLFRQTETPREAKPTGSKVDASSVALFQETLQGLFGLLMGTMLPANPNPAHHAIVKFAQDHANTSIVTTNYDGCMDEALLRNSVDFQTLINDQKQSTAVVDLIKIHGSINWSYCESCHEVKSFDLIDTKQRFESDSFSYAVVGICKNCGGQRKPLLIPPLGLKFVMFPSLIRLWDRAREDIERATLIVVVGFSFSDADTYLNKIVEKSMSFNHQQRMVVCDIDGRVAGKLRRQYSARISAFEPSRVMSGHGSAEQILPRVLEALTKQKGAKKSAGATKSRSSPKKP